MKSLIILELNEINFDVVEFYIDRGERLPGFKALFDMGIITTTAECEYQNLEPWIQWPSIHTGKKFAEHNVYRLGDFINSSTAQYFEKIESAGFSVGAVSPMNSANKLENPAYFIPDPWTKTPSDKNIVHKFLADAVSQAVNDNSEAKLTFRSILSLLVAFLILVKPGRYLTTAKYGLKALSRPWRKALFLDLLLYEVHRNLFEKKKPNFSSLFLNAGAHIQHHYFFNSPYVNSGCIKNPSWYVREDEDPFLEMLRVYDLMVLDLIDQANAELIIATGLSQKPYEQLRYYYRLKNHALFLKQFGIEFTDVLPRMTRDFLISFDTVGNALKAERQLSNILVDQEVKLFAEIDNRGKDIFVVLTYPSEIKDDTVVSCLDTHLRLAEFVTFVAIKNGEHQGKGFAFFSPEVAKFAPAPNRHVCEIHDTVLQFFGVQDCYDQLR